LGEAQRLEEPRIGRSGTGGRGIAAVGAGAADKFLEGFL